ncbi:MAG: hypothetical protein JSR55_14590 [Proteobacteria bacterium]|nr:hypothetical protein [Pseudomonadota bacterium]
MASEVRVSIDFQITGPGWGDILLSVGAKSFRMSGVSYTTDVLGDLLRMALMIATGAWTARTSFDREPPEWRFIAEHVWNHKEGTKRFLLRVLEFPDSYRKQPDEVGDFAFEVECDSSGFAQAVYECAERYRSEHGIESYEWGNSSFPVRAMMALKTALETRDPPLPSPDPNAIVMTIYRPGED